MSPRAAAVLHLGLLAAACATPDDARDEVRVIRLVPAEADGAPEFESTELLVTPRLSAHRAVASRALAPHLHARHAETVYVIEGRARMRVAERWVELGPGSLVHVPAGVAHALEPDGVVTALSIFSPPFDGHDRVPVQEAP